MLSLLAFCLVLFYTRSSNTPARVHPGGWAPCVHRKPIRPQAYPPVCSRPIFPNPPPSQLWWRSVVFAHVILLTIVMCPYIFLACSCRRLVPRFPPHRLPAAPSRVQPTVTPPAHRLSSPAQPPGHLLRCSSVPSFNPLFKRPSDLLCRLSSQLCPFPDQGADHFKGSGPLSPSLRRWVPQASREVGVVFHRLFPGFAWLQAPCRPLLYPLGLSFRPPRGS